MYNYFNMNWCFAIVNGRFAEIFFAKKRGKSNFLGHAYVNKNEYKTKKEKEWIEKDTNKFKLFYRNSVYKDLTNGDIYFSVKRFGNVMNKNNYI